MKKIEQIFKKILLRFIINKKRIPLKVELQDFSKNTNILFIRLNRIGDALVTTPLFSEIKAKTACKISILADKKNYFIFENNPAINNVFIYKKGIAGFLQINKIIKKNNIDVVVDLHDDISTTVTYLVAISKVNHKFGLKKGIDNLYTHTVRKLNPTYYHVIERMMEFSRLFNIEYEKKDINIRYYPTEQSIQSVETFFNGTQPSKNKYVVGINISAGSSARFWGIKRFQSLISFLEQYDITILLMCSPRDLESASKIHSAHKIISTPSFDEFSLAISKLDFLFTPDTSIVHIASAFEIPLFGIYVKYNTNDMIWSPYKSEFECIITEEPNFDNLDFDEVIKKFKPFFEKFYYGKRNS